VTMNGCMRIFRIRKEWIAPTPSRRSHRPTAATQFPLMVLSRSRKSREEGETTNRSTDNAAGDDDEALADRINPKEPDEIGGVAILIGRIKRGLMNAVIATNDHDQQKQTEILFSMTDPSWMLAAGGELHDRLLAQAVAGQDPLIAPSASPLPGH